MKISKALRIEVDLIGLLMDACREHKTTCACRPCRFVLAFEANMHALEDDQSVWEQLTNGAARGVINL